MKFQKVISNIKIKYVLFKLRVRLAWAYRYPFSSKYSNKKYFKYVFYFWWWYFPRKIRGGLNSEGVIIEYNTKKVNNKDTDPYASEIDAPSVKEWNLEFDHKNM